MAGIEIRDLKKAWGGFNAVNGISFSVEPGTLTVLLGPSGCGKSTTLRMIAGLDQPSSGTIRIGGRDVTQAPPAERGLAMVFQNYALFPHLSVAENIVFGLKVRRVPAAERRRRLSRATDVLGLSKLLDRRPSQLSGGQQQRVALARAVVAEASVCLMDEPLSNLDAQLRLETRREIRRLQQQLGMTMVFVTHDQVEAMTLADQVVLMRGGLIEQNSPPDQLYNLPVSAFCARFIGTPPMNLVQLEHDASGARIAGSPAQAGVPGATGDMLLGLRPEDIRVGVAGGVPATVAVAEYHGADSVLECRVGSQVLQVRVEGAQRFEKGHEITLGWSAEDAHLFCATTERRIDPEAAHYGRAA
jgi:sn-glycerol 3-phosphate transport system ATP-binding protein